MHPHNEHRAHRVEKRRVHHITRHYRASGGAVHGDAAEDRKLINKVLDERDAEAVTGGHVRERFDKKRRGGACRKRAAGGRLRHKGKGKGTTVNVLVGHPGAAAAGGTPMGAPPMLRPAAPPVAPTAPPAPGAAPGVAGGVPPGMGPPNPMMAMPPRRAGGRAYKTGGGVRLGKAFTDSVRAGTRVQHNESGKTDQGDVNRKPVITRKTGGAIEAREGEATGPTGDPWEVPGHDTAQTFKLGRHHRASGGSVMSKEHEATFKRGNPLEHPARGGMGPKLKGGARGGEARLEKERRDGATR